MKILIINTNDAGGAAYSCRNLLHGLREIGVDVDFLSVDVLADEKMNIFQRLIKWYKVRKLIVANAKLLAGSPKGFDYFTLSRTGYRIHNHPLVKSADIIHLHWIANLIDYPTFFQNIKKPIVWTLHDGNPCTGGCHYTFGCKRYLTDCSPCEQLRDDVKLYLAKDTLSIKIKSLDNIQSDQLRVVAPSKWLKSFAEGSLTLRRFSHHLIPYGIDKNFFKISDKAEARARFKLPTDKFIILFVASSIEEHRKGFDIIIKLKESLAENSAIEFICVGDDKHLVEGITGLGYIRDKNEIAMAYTAADVFIIPSREDNLPNTMLEALCCGTPVIGFRTGGIIDTIENNTNGYLVEQEDVESIKSHVLDMVTRNVVFDRNEISRNAQAKFSIVGQAREYKEIYQELLN